MLILSLSNRKLHTGSITFSPFKRTTFWSSHKRSMKAIKQGTSLPIFNKSRFILSTQKTLSNLCDSPIHNEQNLVEKLSKIQAEGFEFITEQSIQKAIFDRFSTTKETFIAAIKNYDKTLLEKLVVEDPKGRSDVRFISELLTGARYSKTSDSIRLVTLCSEDPRKPLTLTALVQSGNKRPDAFINFKSGESLFRDFKSGNITQKGLSTGHIQEIPYISEFELGNIMNNTMSLRAINKLRMEYFKEIHNISKNDQLYNHLMVLEGLKPFLEKGEILYNSIMQEEFYKNINLYLELKINVSFYYGHYKQETSLNNDFYNRMEPYVNLDIFNNKENAGRYIARAIITYHNTIKPIMHNIEKTKGTSFDMAKWLKFLENYDNLPIFPI